MHELGIVFNIVKQVLQTVEENNVTEVESITLQVGQASGVVARFLQECYPASVDGTMLEKTKLLIEEIPVMLQCKDCKKNYFAAEYKECPQCGSTEKIIIDGKQFILKEILAR